MPGNCSTAMCLLKPEQTTVTDRIALPEAITVLMPVYNGERYIREAIDSILRQTFQSFEFLIIDDGSTDGTPAILAEYAARDGRFRVITQENRDQPATLNRGLQEATYDWIAIIDHDDISHPQRLELQLRALAENPTARGIGTWSVEITASGATMGLIDHSPTTVAEFRSRRACNAWIGFVHSSMLLHRPTVLAVGGYREAFGSAADSDLWSRIADNHDMLAVPEYLVRYRVHLNSMSFTRISEQQFVVRWIRACQAARRAGLPEPTKEQQRQRERGFAGIGRLRLLRREWLDSFLRRRRVALWEGRRFLAASLFIAATVLDPARSLRRIAAKASTSPERDQPASRVLDPRHDTVPMSPTVE
jgi:glycosyltransferase involved in cell wall biosynthesis